MALSVDGIYHLQRVVLGGMTAIVGRVSDIVTLYNTFEHTRFSGV